MAISKNYNHYRDMGKKLSQERARLRAEPAPEARSKTDTRTEQQMCQTKQILESYIFSAESLYCSKAESHQKNIVRRGEMFIIFQVFLFGRHSTSSHADRKYDVGPQHGIV